MGKIMSRWTVLIITVATMFSVISMPGLRVNAEAATQDIDVLMTATGEILHDSFEDNYTIVKEDNVVTISLWSDGIAYASIYAAQDKGYRQDWDSLLHSLKGMSETIYDAYEPYGYSVVINVLNDLNKEKVLISYMNGVLIYDTVSSAEL